MMNVEDFRIMFRAHLSHELWDKWRNGQLDVSMRRNTPDGCEYEELPKEAADQILDGGEIHSCEDLADPTEMISDRYACSLYGIQSGQSYAAALEWTSRLRAGLDALESLAVRDAVLNAHLSKTEIASALGITRQTLYNRHKELLGELKEQCRRKPRHPIDSTAYRIHDGRTIPAKEKE